MCFIFCLVVLDLFSDFFWEVFILLTLLLPGGSGVLLLISFPLPLISLHFSDDNAGDGCDNDEGDDDDGVGCDDDDGDGGGVSADGNDDDGGDDGGNDDGGGGGEDDSGGGSGSDADDNGDDSSV